MWAETEKLRYYIDCERVEPAEFQLKFKAQINFIAVTYQWGFFPVSCSPALCGVG